MNFDNFQLDAYTSLNINMKLRFLVELSQKIEFIWENFDQRKNHLDILCLILELHKNSENKDLKLMGRLRDKMSLNMSLNHFLNLVVPMERTYARTIQDHEYIIDKVDKNKQDVKHASSPIPLTFVLENIRSAFNIGSIFRTSECLAVKHLMLCGYTATPESLKTKKSAMGCDEVLSWQHVNKTRDAIDLLKNQNIPILALETVQAAKSIYEFKFPSSCAIILGNERHGIEQNILKLCDDVIKIPVYGFKNSLNVANSASIVGYEIRRQWNDL